MPLIRLIAHPRNNKWLVDKMIYIEGLPDSLMYTVLEDRKYLKEPWFIDNPANIPDYVKEVLVPAPLKLRTYASPAEKGMPPIDEEVEVYALCLDYQNGQGEQTWVEIERILDRETPRGERIPEPVRVADIDNDHRDLPFSVPVLDIPVVHLEGGSPVRRVVPPVVRPVTPSSFNCPTCQKVFTKAQALRMHKLRLKHDQVQVPAGV